MDELTLLALSARRGDNDAAGAFVRASQADVWRLCVHLGSREHAEDLVQETYARAFAGLHRFAGRSAARTWLLSIARRTCADAVRAAVKARAAPADVDVQPDHAESVVLHDLLAVLDGERREAFVLTQLVGLTYPEAADVCGCPVGTIRSLVARARADLVAAHRGARRRHTG
ncbi:MAG: sigma-70 family RNA polymerase sigma factor [Jatrophihabitantaceae bacterium]